MDGNIGFIDDFHLALRSAGRKGLVIRSYAKAVEGQGCDSVLRAQAIWSVNKRLNLVPPGQLPFLCSLASSAEHFTDDARRKQREYLTLIGFWSRSCVEYYGFQDCSTRALHVWVQLATKHASWEECVQAVNLALIARHENSLRDPRTNRMGIWRAQTKATKLPAELQDVKAACGQLPIATLRRLQDRWLRPCTCLLERIKSCSHSPSAYMVALDRYGMLCSDPQKPAVPVRICEACLVNAREHNSPSPPFVTPEHQDTTPHQADESNPEFWSEEVSPRSGNFELTRVSAIHTSGDVAETSLGMCVTHHDKVWTTDETFPSHEFSRRPDPTSGVRSCTVQQISPAPSGILTLEGSPVSAQGRRDLDPQCGRGFLRERSDSGVYCIISDHFLVCEVCKGACQYAVSPNQNVREFETAHKIADAQSVLEANPVLHWTRPRIRFAQTSNDPESCHRYNCVLEISRVTTWQWAHLRKPCPAVLIIRAESNEGKMDRQEYARLFCRRHDSLGIDLSVCRGYTRQPGYASVKEFVDLVSAKQMPTETVQFHGLKGISSIPMPAVLQLERFKLLQTLVDRRSYAASQATAGPRCRVVCDVETALSYNQFHSSGAYSGTQLEVLAGAWLRVVFGSLLLWVVLPESLSSEDWADLASQGSDWNPGGKAQAIILDAGDVIFLGPRVVYGHLAMENSAVDGGAVWDDCNLLTIVDALCEFVECPDLVGRQFPLQLPEIVNELDTVLDMYEPCEVLRQELSQRIMNLLWSGCRCVRACDRYCPCHITEGTCTAWCGDHQSTTTWPCMRPIPDTPGRQSSGGTTASLMQ